jgi:putative membrane protein
MENNKTLHPVKSSPNDHMANERTFLAWIRTSIGIMGFGFVVVKFSLFAREVTRAVAEQAVSSPGGHSMIVGIILVVVGALMLFFAYVRYDQTKKQIESNTYYHSSAFNKVITAVLLMVSILLIIYLMNT